MLRTQRFLVVALPLLLVLVAAHWLRPEAPESTTARPHTIEPTLPLRLELHALPADASRGEPSRLEVTADASGEEVQDVSLSLVLPEGIGSDDGVLRTAGGFALRAGDRRTFVVPLWVRRPGVFPIRLKASFRLPDGRILQTEQGILLRSGAGGPLGRHHAGAYEWMGEPQP